MPLPRAGKAETAKREHKGESRKLHGAMVSYGFPGDTMRQEGLSIAMVLVALASFASAWPAVAQHEQHRGAQHAAAQGASLEVRQGPGGRVVTLRVGPLPLPARTGHHEALQAPDFFWEVPFDGWLVAYQPRLVDAAGSNLPGRLLHHVGFWHTTRADFLCPNKPEHIFGAGGELNEWPAVPGFGYRVTPGERIRVDTMFHNPTATDYPEVYLEVKIEYVLVEDGIPLRNYYPAWFDVQECRNSGYDLRPGSNVKAGQHRVRFGGILLGVGGHLHDYGLLLRLENTSTKQKVTELIAQLDDAGLIQSMPTETFTNRGGYRIRPGDTLRVTAVYDNKTGRALPDGAMGIVVGYFVPDDESALAQLKWSPRSPRR